MIILQKYWKMIQNHNQKSKYKNLIFWIVILYSYTIFFGINKKSCAVQCSGSLYFMFLHIIKERFIQLPQNSHTWKHIM